MDKITDLDHYHNIESHQNWGNSHFELQDTAIQHCFFRQDGILRLQVENRIGSIYIIGVGAVVRLLWDLIRVETGCALGWKRLGAMGSSTES